MPEMPTVAPSGLSRVWTKWPLPLAVMLLKPYEGGDDDEEAGDCATGTVEFRRELILVADCFRGEENVSGASFVTACRRHAFVAHCVTMTESVSAFHTSTRIKVRASY